MRLSRDVLLVGGGNLGFNLSHYLDCHVYVIDGGDELALVDTGIGGPHGQSSVILQNARDDGVNLGKISTLLLTHYHVDHAGGAADFHRELGLNVLGSPLTAKTLEAGNEETVSLPFAKSAGFYPADYVYEACSCAPLLIEAKPFKVGRLTVTPFDTPGHCRGHVSLLVEGGDRRYLIGGDLVFSGGTIIAQNIPDCSIHEYSDSVKKMAKVDFDAFLPGHFSISMKDGKRHIDAAAVQFGRLGIPKNAI